MKQHEFRQAPWFDAEGYPFTSRYLPVEGGRMHYIDEGSGPVVLLVHGTPTWSYLYRQQIAALLPGHRCVAVDHIGFGLSDKPVDAPYTPEWHGRNLERLVAHLDLQDITLVVHDFGGPIGLGFALRQPDRIRQVVLLNTWLWETADLPAAQKVDRLVRSWLGRFLYLRLNASPKWLLPSAFADKAKLGKALHRHYTEVFPDRDSRHGLLGLAYSLLGSSEWYGRQWAQLDVLAHKPFHIAWGMKDTFINPGFLEKWLGRLPHVARTLRLPDAGHFLQEEAPGQLSRFILQAMEG